MNEDRFKDRKEALVWLQSHGKISQGKFYQDCKQGFADIGGRRYNLNVAPDKTISKFQVSEYGIAYFGGVSPVIPVDYTDKKSKADLDTAEANARMAMMKADEMERALSNKWMLCDHHEYTMAAYSGLIEDAFSHRIHLDHIELQIAARGTASEFAYALQRFRDRILNDVAAVKEIDLEFEETTTDEP